jgi:hypothetical protein
VRTARHKVRGGEEGQGQCWFGGGQAKTWGKHACRPAKCSMEERCSPDVTAKFTAEKKNV